MSNTQRMTPFHAASGEAMPTSSHAAERDIDETNGASNFRQGHDREHHHQQTDQVIADHYTDRAAA